MLRLVPERRGRPLAFYTDKASLFQTAPKNSREPQAPRDAADLPPTQIGQGRLRRTVHHVNWGSVTAGERALGAQFPDGAEPPGERAARWLGQHAGRPARSSLQALLQKEDIPIRQRSGSGKWEAGSKKLKLGQTQCTERSRNPKLSKRAPYFAPESPSSRTRAADLSLILANAWLLHQIPASRESKKLP